MPGRKPWRRPPPGEIITVHPEKGNDYSLHFLPVPYMVDLRNKALKNGHTPAIHELLRLNLYLTRLLERLTFLYPEKIKEIAAHHYLWPLLCCPNVKANKFNLAKLDKMDLGSKINIKLNIDAQRLGLLALPAKKWAVELICAIQHLRIAFDQASVYSKDALAGVPEPERNEAFINLINRCLTFQTECFKEFKYTAPIIHSALALKPYSLDQETVKNWWHVAEEILLLNTDGDPLSIPELKEIGIYGKDHASGYKSIMQIKNIETDELFNTKSQQSNIRAALYKRLQQEFERLAKHLPDTDLFKKFRAWQHYTPPY